MPIDKEQIKKRGFLYIIAAAIGIFIAWIIFKFKNNAPDLSKPIPTAQAKWIIAVPVFIVGIVTIITGFIILKRGKTSGGIYERVIFKSGTFDKEKNPKSFWTYLILHFVLGVVAIIGSVLIILFLN